jgi:hypothetical protein
MTFFILVLGFAIGVFVEYKFGNPTKELKKLKGFVATHIVAVEAIAKTDIADVKKAILEETSKLRARL